MNKIFTSIKISGGIVALAGLVLMLLAPLIGKNIFDFLWAVDPLTYLGGVLLIIGLGTVAGTYVGLERTKRNAREGINGPVSYTHLTLPTKA